MECQIQDNIENLNFNYNYSNGLHQLDCSNSFLGKVSDNLVLRASPQRKYSPKAFHCNNYQSNICYTNDYCCNYIYNPEPCEKCINNHCNLCHKDIPSVYNNNKNYNDNEYRTCQLCHNFPCCCCSVCHTYPCICKCCPICHSVDCKCCPQCNTFPCKCCRVCHSVNCKCCPQCNTFPCKCCRVCHSVNCKCCPQCNTFPCKCCPVCHSLECICCPNCKKYPCKCCPVCHLEKCCCCEICHKYPCVCCPNCHFENCKCCTVCHNYPCTCCSVCHMAKCICCQNCKTYPCRCCPDCHYVDCRCCIECGSYPCRCCDIRCNCCDIKSNCYHTFQNMKCPNCHNNPCICCPYCHFKQNQLYGCTCGKQCIAMSLNAMNCPVHNVHTMKHNDGCPFLGKCSHEPKCAHPKKNNNSNIDNNDNNDSEIYNNSMPNHFQNDYNNPNHIHHHFNNNKPNNSPNDNDSNNSKENIKDPYYKMCSDKNCPLNKNKPNNNNNNKKITYILNDPNDNDNDDSYDENNNYNQFNNGPNENDSLNNNIPNKESNDNNNIPNKQKKPYDNNDGNNDDNNDNDDDNNIPNKQKRPYDNNKSGIFNGDGNNQDNQNNPNNPNNGSHLSPISSAFPPNSPFFNINEPGQKSNWIFCPKCNVYHRCPHPGCDHNPNKRTTTHQCIHDEDPNQNPNQNPNQISQDQNPGRKPNYNPNYNPNDRRSPRQSQMDRSQRNPSSPRKRDVFSSCPYQEELGQFVGFLGYLMEVESRIEDMKIELARRDDFNFEDIFRIFEVDGKGYIEPEDLKQGLKLLGLNPSDFDIKLLMKRFDLNRQGLLTYSDFFDMVVSFEKNLRNSVQIRPPNSCCSCKSPDIFECDTLIAIKNLFKFIIECERDTNQIRADFDSLRSKFADVVHFLDYSRRGIIKRSDLKLYLTQFNKFTTSRECDLLFIRLDKNRKGEVGIDQIEDELMYLR